MTLSMTRKEFYGGEVSDEFLELLVVLFREEGSLRVTFAAGEVQISLENLTDGLQVRGSPIIPSAGKIAGGSNILFPLAVNIAQLTIPHESIMTVRGPQGSIGDVVASNVYAHMIRKRPSLLVPVRCREDSFSRCYFRVLCSIFRDSFSNGESDYDHTLTNLNVAFAHYPDPVIQSSMRSFREGRWDDKKKRRCELGIHQLVTIRDRLMEVM